MYHDTKNPVHLAKDDKFIYMHCTLYYFVTPSACACQET